MLISQQKQYFKKLLLKFVIHCSREIGWNAEIQYYKKPCLLKLQGNGIQT